LESVKKEKRQNLNKEVLPMLLSGSPDRTSFATFVCMKKQMMCTISWKKSLESVEDLKRQNLIKEVLPMLLSGSPYWKHLELLRGILILTI